MRSEHTVGIMWFTGRQVIWLVCPAALLLPCELTSCSGIRRGGNRVCSSGNQQLMMRSTHWGSALLDRLDVLFPLRSPFVLRLWLHSACFSKAVISHRSTAALQQSCIQDTDVSSCCIQSRIFEDCSHICPHSQKLHSLVRFTPHLFIAACSFNAPLPHFPLTQCC